MFTGLRKRIRKSNGPQSKTVNSLMVKEKGIWTCIFIPFLLIILSCNLLISQSTVENTLRSSLAKATKDSEKIFIMNELSSHLKDLDSEQALNYARKALSLSRSINDQEHEVESMFNLGTLLYDSPKKDSSLVYFMEGERKAEELGLGQLQSDYLMSLANYHRYNNRDSATIVNYLFKSVELSKSSNYTYGTARSYAKLASVYTKYNEIELCEKYLEKSAKYYLKTEDGDMDIAHYYNEVGNKIWDYNPKKSMDLFFKGLTYSDNHPSIKISLAKAHSIIDEPEQALEYLESAMTNLDTMQNDRVLGVASSLLAEVQLQLGDDEAATNTCDKGIIILSPLSRSNQTGLPSLYRTKGKILELKGQEKAALEMYLKSLELSKSVNRDVEFPKANVTIGNYYATRSPKKGEEYCKNALAYTHELNATSLEIEACDCLYNIYKNENASTTALKYFEKKVRLQDSLGAVRVEHALEINSTIAEKDKLLAEELYQKEIKEAKLKNQYRLNTILLISSLLGILLISFLTKSIKRIRNQNKEIKSKTKDLKTAISNLARSNEDLERFAHVASHDLKSPLNTIRNFSRLLGKGVSSDVNPKAHKYLEIIEQSGKRMSDLIEDILEYSKLSTQNVNEQEIINLNQMVDEISQMQLNPEDGKKLRITAGNLPNLKYQQSKIFLLFKNLIENGLKYNQSEKPTVELSYNTNMGKNSIKIKDNGIGIEKEYFDKVFVMFERLNKKSEYEGTGLGLATCKKIVDDFGGNISIASEVGKGTVFTLEFPDKMIA